MFNFFKKRKYRKVILPKVTGVAHGITVTFLNYPVREAEDQSSKRIEFFTDFNAILISKIWDQTPDFERFLSMASNSMASFVLKIGDAPPFEIQITVNVSKSKRTFEAEMPDAIISAFQNEKIGR